MVGTHSICKFVLIHARRSGYSCVNLNVCDQWKHFKQLVDTYVYPDIPYPDVKTAAALAIGGTVKYELLKENGVDDCWLVEIVFLETLKLYQDKKIVMALSKDLLWACFDAESQDCVPLQIIKRIHTAYEDIQKIDSTLNSVCKVPLVVCGNKDQLLIEELFDKEAGGTGAEVPAHDDSNSPANPEMPNRRRSRYSSEIQAVFAQLMPIQKNEELTTEL